MADLNSASANLPPLLRTAYLIGGLVLAGLAVVGAILPVMPSTIFAILAAGCFARSSPRLEAWLLRNKVFGPAVISWRLDRSMPTYAKVAASTGIGIGGLVLFLSPASLAWRIVGWVVLALCLIYILTRKTRQTDYGNNHPSDQLTPNDS